MRPVFADRPGYDRRSESRSGLDDRQGLDTVRRYETRPGEPGRNPYEGNRAGFIGGGGADRREGGYSDNRREGGRLGDRHEGAHFDGRREYGHEQREWQREGGFRGNERAFDRYRHDYEYRDWHADHDRDRLLIVNRYGYQPWGYGFRPGWNDYRQDYWGSNLGWGFDLRFGYWYGPSYYDPGLDWWYGPRAPYQYGVRAEELILRDSTLHDWALRWFDTNHDGYLDRDEVLAAAWSLRQMFDYNGDGWIQSVEYNAAIERLRGGSGYDGYDRGHDNQTPSDNRPY